MADFIRHGERDILSRSIEHNGTIYLQGFAALDRSVGIEGQTRQTLAQIDDALTAHGIDRSRLLQAQIWVKDITQRPAMNAVWIEWLAGGPAPTRACVQAELGTPDCLVEIMVTAARG